jgi:hypothetical protein
LKQLFLEILDLDQELGERQACVRDPTSFRAPVSPTLDLHRNVQAQRKETAADHNDFHWSHHSLRYLRYSRVDIIMKNNIDYDSLVARLQFLNNPRLTLGK